MFRTTHIRTKLAVALTIPLVALVGLAGFEVLSAEDDVSAARAQADLAESSVGPGSLVVHLQNERNRAAIDLIGLDDGGAIAVATNADARALVDPAAEQFRTAVNRRGAEVQTAFAPAWAAIEGLEALRKDVDAYSGPLAPSSQPFADEVFQRYTDIIEAFFDGTSATALTVDDSALRNGVEIVDATTRQTEVRARIVRTLVQAQITGDLGEPAIRQEVAALRERSRGFDEDIRTNASGAYDGVADATLAEAGVQSFNRQVDDYLVGASIDVNQLLESVKFAPETGYAGLRDRVAVLLADAAGGLQGDAATRQKVFAMIALAALVLAVAVTWLASRSITRPLRSLQRQAEEMAGTRLPQAVRRILDTPPGEDVVIPKVVPIVVDTKDEVAEVAAALSAVQASAVDLAVEQAVLRRNISDSYVNLGRRNQNLLSRQIDFITDLERNETDPDTLEGLFRLDHLATRMRRNAESLLVLAGVDPPRQWSAPVKLSDVVRAALGEVEDYQRVVVRHLEPAAITGAVAADVAHVIAELIENALSFSPAEQSVEVRGRLTTEGYTVAVTDNGLGMSVDDVERANRRLAGKESFTVAPSRYLGHYVAGHLASRLGVVVELQDSPAGGITARIDVPMGLLIDDEITGPLVTPPRPPVAAAEASSGGPARTSSVDAASTTPGGLPRRGERTPALAVAEPSEPVTAPAPVPVPVASAPAPVAAESNGLGALAIRPVGGSMYSVAANGSRPRPAEVAPVPAAPTSVSDGPTAAGLARRVPGAQRPDAAFTPRASEPTPAAGSEPVRTSPEDVYSFLSSFQSGVARGRADAAGANDPQEDGR